MDYYSFTDPEGMEGWVGLVGWPIADALPTKWSHVVTSTMDQAWIRESPPATDRRSYHWATPPISVISVNRTDTYLTCGGTAEGWGHDSRRLDGRRLFHSCGPASGNEL